MPYKTIYQFTRQIYNKLLHCETLENFNDLYDSLSATWSEAFVIYFEDHLKTDFINNAIRMNFCAVFVDLEI